MTAPTVPVTIDLADFGGPALDGVKVSARMSDVDFTADGIVVSTKAVSGLTLGGVVVLQCFPNAVAPSGLGTRGTTIRFTASIPGSRGLDVQAAIPNAPCNLVDVMVGSEPVGLTDAQLAVQQAQASAVQTSNDADATAADRIQTGQDRDATGADRVQTGNDRTQTGLDRAAAAGSANAAAGSRSAIDNRIYPGTYAVPPATRPDGSAILDGDMYFNSVANAEFVRNAGVWVLVPAASSADMANAVDPAKGAALTGFSRALAYGAGNTVARELMRARGADVQFVMAGDSIAAGTTAPNTVTIPIALQAYYPALALATYTNDGVPGSRLDSTITGGAASGADMVGRYAANVFPKRPAASGSVRSLLVVDIGANDFPVLTSFAQVAAWVTKFESYCATARADGFVVVAFTIMPRVGNQSELNEECRKRMNDAIRRSLNVDAYVDAAQLFTDTTNATYFIDGTHPTDTGNKVLGRALAAQLAKLGLTIATSALPAANADPSVTPAMQAVLDSACIECTTAQGINLAAAVPAIGAGDYTVEAWFWQATPTPGGGSNMSFLQKTGGSAFGKVDGTTGFHILYVLPGAGANWSPQKIHGGFWNHGLISRTGTTASFYVNGVLIGTAVDNNVHTALDSINFVPGKLARIRAYSRALSAAEALASYNNLSAYNANEASYIFALDDGDRNAGAFVGDLSPSKAHLILTDLTKVKIKRPALRGSMRKQTVGNATFVLAPGYRITSYTAEVVVSGGGNVDIGDTNGGGQFIPNTVLAVGKKALPLPSPFTASGTLFCNAVGYTINHTISFEAL